MKKLRIFVSFDYECDRQYKYLLNCWNNQANIPFCFEDGSSDEIQSSDISVVKRALSAKIHQADYVLVIVGEDANRLHPDHKKIGERNWQNYEIATAKAWRIPLIAVQLKSSYSYPEELIGVNAKRCYDFSLESISKAIWR
ncbi:TIR domain-containing protein [Selenomonas ruminantium]|uniref:TIR domain-containing protein n=1 Tax=Selenomonas ruminantium TaxID=971 RepID=UPI0026EA25FE|nr:TIR domain-containing protein [Selenomonas ruminantium]